LVVKALFAGICGAFAVDGRLSQSGQRKRAVAEVTDEDGPI
jgi:hypothetical protein